MKFSTIFVVAITFFICLSEILAYKNTALSIVMFYLWAFAGIIFFVFSFKEIYKALAEDLRNKRYQSLVSLIIIIAISLLFMVIYSPINHESTQEIASALNNFSLPDFGYSKQAFLGYPNRQYILP